MRRVPVLISRPRWFRLTMRVTGHDSDGFPIFADAPRGYRCRSVTARHRTQQLRREAKSGKQFDVDEMRTLGEDLGQLLGEIAALRAALTAIATPEGRYSRDPLTHANNTIENVVRIAKEALAAPAEARV